ncbi:MAG TPA: hypothetical protein PKA63_10535 [Oligoflexia bacterium]|nr:hypothetical protein [Oligoflexia bacterium]HMP49094.1 hypothetical protein [Oligoflexia bacterium]
MAGPGSFLIIQKRAFISLPFAGAQMLLIALILMLISVSACERPEPQYQLKEPFGNNTMSAVDDLEREPDVVRIPKKNFDRAKWEEMERRNDSIKKILKQAREWDPNSNGKKRRSL